MTILKGIVIPRYGELPVEIEVAYVIVSELCKNKLLKVRKEVLIETEKNFYTWELTDEADPNG